MPVCQCGVVKIGQDILHTELSEHALGNNEVNVMFVRAVFASDLCNLFKVHCLVRVASAV